MYFKLMFFGFYFIVQWVYSQNCDCKCKPVSPFSSEHPSSPSAGTWVVRPKILPKPSVTLPLSSSSSQGPCFRKCINVKPASILKRIRETTLTPQTSINQSCSNNTNKSNLEGYQPIDVSKAYEKVCENKNHNYVPADAVSLAIAYKLAQNDYTRNIQEDKLMYGFRKIPVEVPCPKTVPPKIVKMLLPEGNLYDLNGEIVELKTKRKSHVMTDDLEQEAVEDMIDMPSFNEDDRSPVLKPTLSDLGYGPARIKSAMFVNVSVKNASTPAPVESELSEPCGDDEIIEVTEIPCSDDEPVDHCSDEEPVVDRCSDEVETIVEEESCEET